MKIDIRENMEHLISYFPSCSKCLIEVSVRRTGKRLKIATLFDLLYSTHR